VLEHSYREGFAQHLFLDALRVDSELSLTNYGKFFLNMRFARLRYLRAR
jgi:hypothetical protein